MELDTTSSPVAAALSARGRLGALARARGDETHLAAFARTAIFTEALLAEVHARFNELRTVAKP